MWLSNYLFILIAQSGERAHDSPYEVEITIPIENYDPIQFTFAKMCGEF